ncbi:MAG: PrsW family intramembrane metalloprotease, partial [Clostridia bacterium]|nr:PrsW family intramembrane metalloprotease [Clostridia bacterium]
GCGILYVRKEKRLFFAGTFGLLTVAVTFHAIYNLLVWSKWNAAGVLLPIAIYAMILPFLYSKKLKSLLFRSK